MNADLLTMKYLEYIRSADEKSGVVRNSRYYKDKISRLRRLLVSADSRLLCDVNDDNFFELIEIVKQSIPNGGSKRVRTFHLCADYLVVLRQLYEMNTGRIAPRYCHYAGRRVVSKL